MTTQTVTLDLPEQIYQKLKVRAAQTQRSLEAEALDALTTSITPHDQLDPELEATIESLQFLDEEALLRSARSSFSPTAAEHLEELHFKRQSEGLTNEEAQIATKLVGQYQRAMLIRAQAVALLKQHGYDVSSLLTGL